MRKVVYIVGLSGVLMSSLAFARLEKEDKVSCQEMGYTVDYTQCAMQNRTIPLLCPYSESGGNLKAMCYISSCRGYFLKEENFSEPASDGRPLSAHIKGTIQFKRADGGGIKGCKAGYIPGENGQLEEVWYYKISECAEGSSFQNGRCDTGCDRTRKYPYDTHPGNLAGNVEGCFDEKGDCFGYTSCNDGWTLNSGRCELNQCSIQNYPYFSNPNLVEDRGLTKTCKIGGNTYYQYTNTDANGATLTSGGCIQNGHTLAAAACIKQCVFSNCTSEDRVVTYTKGSSTYTTTYHEWACKMDTAHCRVGDYATFNGQNIGIIYHLPDATSDKVMIVATTHQSKTWGANEGVSVDTPLVNGSRPTDYNGKYNSYVILNFAKSNSNYNYPAIEYATAYVPSNCNDAICQAGEWYLPSVGELNILFDNRYMMYNVMPNSSIYYSGFSLYSSNEGGVDSACHKNVGVVYCWPKTFGYNAVPVLSFTLK